MSSKARILTAIAAVLLIAVYLVPLGMKISVHSVTGVQEYDLQNINELNHYIGMKVIDPSTIPVLRVMPWVVGGLIAAGLLVALVGRRRLLYAWMAAFFAFGAAGMAEFWWWEYDYGHHLDEANAIIKIPGMSYQPPLIGSKQLLNFTAVSVPDWGAWIVGAAFALGVIAIVVARHSPPARPATLG
ncbi:MAG: hypothetical protein B7Z72_05420 [Gemmatimonadetes bacterium 21-71-4]|nr:MAG: hypothetical protein B7Z72_05420 [Gemmatimonadetes bacterium 21-71-4]